MGALMERHLLSVLAELYFEQHFSGEELLGMFLGCVATGRSQLPLGQCLLQHTGMVHGTELACICVCSLHA